MEERPSDFINVAEEAALAAGRVVRTLRDNADLRITQKPDGTIVTNADVEAERRARAVIRFHYPDHEIHGEELGADPAHPDTPHLWTVDPIDGTSAYVNFETTACTNVAVLTHKKAVAGAVYNPFTHELFTAAEGAPATLNGHPLPLVDSGTLNYQLSRSNADEVDVLVKHLWSERHVNKVIEQGGSPAYNLACVAKGSHSHFILDCTREARPEDYGAPVLLVRQAGGRVTDLDGNDIDAFSHSGFLVASSQAANHDRFLRLLQQYEFGRTAGGHGRIVFVGGFYGTGKSTLAKKLEDYGYRRFGSDLTRREFGLDRYDAGDSDIVWGTIFWKAGSVLEDGGQVVIESTYLDEAQRFRDYDLARSKDADGVFIEVVCSERETKRRIAARPTSPDGLHVPTNRTQFYDATKDRWEPVVPGLLKRNRQRISYLVYDSETHTLYEGLVRPWHREWVEAIAQQLAAPLVAGDGDVMLGEKRYAIARP